MRKEAARVALREALLKVNDMAPTSAFQHYLHGYINAFDLFPDYELARTEQGSLVEDFWTVIADITDVAIARKATLDLDNPEEKIGVDELKARKKEAARRFLCELAQNDRRTPA